jgi:hypothetical protein
MLPSSAFLLWVSLCVVGAIFGSLILWCLPLFLPVIDWRFFAAKLTFLWIMLAVGTFQYNFFYDIAFRQFFWRYMPEWERLKQEFRQALLIDIESALRHFSTALALLFGVGITLVISVTADFIELVFIQLRLWRALSYGSFIIALVVFVTLCVCYLLLVRRELRVVQEKIRGLRN